MAEEQKQQQNVQHTDASTSKQVELDALYAQMLQNIEDHRDALHAQAIEDRRGAMTLHMEEKEKWDDEEDEKKEMS